MEVELEVKSIEQPEQIAVATTNIGNIEPSENGIEQNLEAEPILPQSSDDTTEQDKSNVETKPAVEVSTPSENEQESVSPKLQKILDRTGYPYQKTGTQHIYGPPPGKEDERLPAGVQVHVGKLSWTAMEDSLIEVFEQAGEIYELRLMMDPKTGQNKGFAFITFCTKEAADNAVRMFNNYTINGKSITVVIASSNNTLFIGSIPKTKTREEIRLAFSNEVQGIVDVLLQPSLKTIGNWDKNRGFCFLNFEDYKTAAAARQTLRSKIPIKMWSDYKTYTCDWADPVEEISPEVMATVKTLFVKNISERTSELLLRECFSKYGEVEKVVVHKHYAFVFMADRGAALRAIEAENNNQLADTTISVELAKPVSEEHRKKIKELKEKRHEYVGGQAPHMQHRLGRHPPGGLPPRRPPMGGRFPPGYGGYDRGMHPPPPAYRPDPYDLYYGYPPPPSRDPRGVPRHPHPPGPDPMYPPRRGGYYGSPPPVDRSRRIPHPPPPKRDARPDPYSAPPPKRGRVSPRYPPPPRPASSYGHYASGYDYPPQPTSYGGFASYEEPPAAYPPPPAAYAVDYDTGPSYGGATYEDFSDPYSGY